MGETSYASRRLVMPIVGLGESFYLAPLTAPEPRAAFAELGLSDVIVDYMVGRVAPMGRVPAEVAIAALYMFHPDGVRPHIPAAWDLAPPERIMEIKRENAELVLRRLLGDWVSSPDATEVAALARGAAESCEIAGRPLTAGLASQPWPDEPHLAIWHAFTLLREYRGDTHNAALAANGLDGAQAQQLMAHAGSAGCLCHATFTKDWTGVYEGARITRNWPEAAWSAAAQRMRDRGLVDGSGTITQAGMELHLEIERHTDYVTGLGWEGEGAQVERLAELLRGPAQVLRTSVVGGIYDGFQMMN